MTIKKIITLQNLLITLCAIVIILIGYKGYQFQLKVSWVAEADRLYAEHKLVEAEALYTKAQNNRFLNYKEQEIAAKLTELAPITKINEQLASLNHTAQNATRNHDYEGLIQVYEQWNKVSSTYLEPEEKYSPYYRQISDIVGISANMKSYFQQFEEQFLSAASSNLKKAQYKDETFKWNLLRLPSEFFGGEKKFTAQILDELKNYDETKMNQLASANTYNTLYIEVLNMLKQYDEHQIDADWVTAGVENIGLALLKKDLENNNYRNFAEDAKQYETFVTDAGFKSSKVVNYIVNRYSEIMKEAKKLTANQEFQQAINIYEQLHAYKDTTDLIKSVKMEWLKAEPARILPEQPQGYLHVSGGTDRFESKVYAAAADQGNLIYFGRMNSNDAVQVLTYSDLPSSEQIQNMTIDKDLSTSSIPVLLIQSASDNRTAIYTALEVRSDQIVLLYRIEADEITVNPDGTLTVINPVGEGAGETTIYERQGDSYHFAKVQVNITDIDGSLLAEYPGIKVRFTCTVFMAGAGEVIALAGNNYMMLTGNFNFYEGDITVTGTFSQFRDIDLFGEPFTVPVFEVETVQ
ncbi:hypothetical protein [Paenibacillus segetis]|uniref:Arylsulfotransferase (ASST) n=1 Tax=Paenibacillus segetis TaxID=1325360 RepID=A0ABQ1YEC0_9BACL|nr:hypothetical protein [Paenibacillus segetis]GGH23036.1 hypothetical protein GCM10008013_21860 [Paenibacillus segetis]